MLSLLILGDIHGETNALINILSDALDNSLSGVVLTGDIGSEILIGASGHAPMQRRMYEISVRWVMELAATTDIPVFFVPGNRDLPALNISMPGGVNIDCLQGCPLARLGDFTLAGIGGSNWINGEFPYEWQEEDAYAKLKDSLTQTPLRHLLLVSHCPPIGCKLDLLAGSEQHVGSRAVRKLITDFHPLLCISAHIHEGAGVDVVEDTLCINAGSILTPHPIVFTGPDRVPKRSVAMAEQCFLVQLHNTEPPLILVHRLLNLPHANVDVKAISYMFADGQLSRVDDRAWKEALQRAAAFVEPISSPLSEEVP